MFIDAAPATSLSDNLAATRAMSADTAINTLFNAGTKPKDGAKSFFGKAKKATTGFMEHCSQCITGFLEALAEMESGKNPIAG